VDQAIDVQTLSLCVPVGDDEARAELWRGALAHHLEDSDWAERDSEDSRTQLRGFIEAAIPYVAKYQKASSTQLNESLHAIKAKHAPKRITWENSLIGRCGAAVMTFNDGPGWVLAAYDKLRPKYEWPALSVRARTVLEKAFAASAAEAVQRRERDAQQAANRQRLVRKHRLDEAPAEGFPVYGQDSADPSPTLAHATVEPDEGDHPTEMNVALYGFHNPGTQCHLCTVASCLLSLGPIVAAILAERRPSGVCRALQTLLRKSADRRAPLRLTGLVRTLNDILVDDGVRASFFSEYQPRGNSTAYLRGTDWPEWSLC
jgi:hypothetical protein